MTTLSAGVVVLIAIVAASAVVAVAAAMHRVYSGRGDREKNTDAEGNDAMIAGFSNEQSHYMRDVRMRGQLQAWGVAPAYEDTYQPPRSQVGGTRTETSFGYG